MTQCDVLFRYGTPPSEAAVLALARIREVYGIRSLVADERAHTVRIEYDATRLSEDNVQQLLRRSGLNIVERISLIPAQPEPAPAA